jgi:hypothetical protein
MTFFKKSSTKKDEYKPNVINATENEMNEKKFCSCCKWYSYILEIGTGVCSQHGEYAYSKEICPKFEFDQNSYNRYVSFDEGCAP